MRNISMVGVAVGAWFGLHSSAQATVQIDIDLGAQRMHVNADSGAHYDWPISSGRPGHATPHGVFGPQAMYPIVYSHKYGNAPMPHSIFFHGQYAIHGTTAVGALGHVASHGCVRLAPENAAVLYNLVEHEGARIVISGGAPERIADNPHKKGHRVAAAMRKRMKTQALGYAPLRGSQTLKQWLAHPTGTN